MDVVTRHVCRSIHHMYIHRHALGSRRTARELLKRSNVVSRGIGYRRQVFPRWQNSFIVDMLASVSMLCLPRASDRLTGGQSNVHQERRSACSLVYQSIWWEPSGARQSQGGKYQDYLWPPDFLLFVLAVTFTVAHVLQADLRSGRIISIGSEVLSSGKDLL